MKVKTNKKNKHILKQFDKIRNCKDHQLNYSEKLPSKNYC